MASGAMRRRHHACIGVLTGQYPAGRDVLETICERLRAADAAALQHEELANACWAMTQLGAAREYVEALAERAGAQAAALSSADIAKLARAVAFVDVYPGAHHVTASWDAGITCVDLGPRPAPRDRLLIDIQPHCAANFHQAVSDELTNRGAAVPIAHLLNVIHAWVGQQLPVRELLPACETLASRVRRLPAHDLIAELTAMTEVRIHAELRLTSTCWMRRAVAGGR